MYVSAANSFMCFTDYLQIQYFLTFVEIILDVYLTSGKKWQYRSNTPAFRQKIDQIMPLTHEVDGTWMEPGLHLLVSIFMTFQLLTLQTFINKRIFSNSNQ